jgi:hypothetical protein
MVKTSGNIIEKLLMSFMSIVFGVALISPLQIYLEGANITGGVAFIITLLPLMFGLTVAYVGIKSILGAM